MAYGFVDIIYVHAHTFVQDSSDPLRAERKALL